jgi:hypothetical protein
MKRIAFAALIVLIASVIAHAQDISCESHKDGDTTVVSCESDTHTSVMRCDADGCHSSSAKKSPISDDILRKMCDGTVQTTPGIMEDSCRKLKISVQTYTHVCADFLADPKVPNSYCKAGKSNYDVSAVAIEHWRNKASDERTTKTLELCEKGVFDKPYCDNFKSKMGAK